MDAYKVAIVSAAAVLTIANYARFALRRNRLRSRLQLAGVTPRPHGALILSFTDQNGTTHEFEGRGTSWVRLPDRQACPLSTEAFLFEVWRAHAAEERGATK